MFFSIFGFLVLSGSRERKRTASNAFTGLMGHPFLDFPPPPANARHPCCSSFTIFYFFSPQIKIVKTFFWFCCSEEIIFSIIFFFHYLLLFFQRQLHFSVETVCILVNGVAFALGDFLYCLLHSLRVHFIVKSRFFISRIIESKTTDRDDETGSEPKNWTS